MSKLPLAYIRKFFSLVFNLRGFSALLAVLNSRLGFVPKKFSFVKLRLFSVNQLTGQICLKQPVQEQKIFHCLCVV